MLKLGFSESRRNFKLGGCILRPPYSNAMSRCAFTFYGKIAFSGTERINWYWNNPKNFSSISFL